jgi:hypothetical protein
MVGVMCAGLIFSVVHVFCNLAAAIIPRKAIFVFSKAGDSRAAQRKNHKKPEHKVSPARKNYGHSLAPKKTSGDEYRWKHYTSAK